MDRDSRILTWWLVSHGAVLALWVVPWPYRGASAVRVDISQAFPALMVWATLFVLFVQPLLRAPRIIHSQIVHEPGPLRKAGRIVLMAALASPFWFLAQFVSDTSPPSMAVAVALWFVVAVWVECMCAAFRGLERGKAHYLIVVSILCGWVPLVYYVRYEILRMDSSWLSMFCPVWTVARAASGAFGRPVLAAAIFFGGTAAVAAILSSLRRPHATASPQASQAQQR